MSSRKQRLLSLVVRYRQVLEYQQRVHLHVENEALEIVSSNSNAVKLQVATLENALHDMALEGVCVDPTRLYSGLKFLGDLDVSLQQIDGRKQEQQDVVERERVKLQYMAKAASVLRERMLYLEKASQTRSQVRQLISLEDMFLSHNRSSRDSR